MLAYLLSFPCSPAGTFRATFKLLNFFDIDDFDFIQNGKLHYCKWSES